MFDARHIEYSDQFFIVRTLHIIERSGLAMAGAMCGTFVAAQLSQTEIALFQSLAFIVAMVLSGAVGFYLGIDIPKRASMIRARRQLDPVHFLSAGGTFIAAMAAVFSVYGLVFDVIPQPIFEAVVACWWLLGIALQTGAGSLGRMQLVRRAAA